VKPNFLSTERFLDENGQLLSKIPESLLPFGTGRRVCLGEDFARKEVFLLFIWLFSRYKFYKVPGKESESCLKLNTVSGIIHQPVEDMQLCVKKR
jgi:cytochrome P450